MLKYEETICLYVKKCLKFVKMYLRFEGPILTLEKKKKS